MIAGMLAVSVVLFAVTIAIALLRMILGPSMPDRVIAMDVIGVNLLALIGVVSVLYGTKAYLEVILILGILSFISTIAFSKYIERGVIIERKRDR
ncbi:MULTISPECIES: Na(+)/H(+) antiporter subunit F1 [Sporosarcina]|uniref:Na(+)/H(+) antiporter subunit F1 n=1 Tax=Sporosarcina TaxID=1569 RepID=UPI00058B3424|nr:MULTISPECIES: Na(+)/H(+) antiporter subunit F1 [Sporosarcina]WJY27144.1 Na(+)/H(+) antiporter subunit F1 [Sporosarcina sp. 0.2-SM1T-5]